MSQKKLDKEDEHLLRAYARELPVVFETSYELHRLTGAEILKMGHLDYKGEKLVLDKVYEYRMPVQVAANHYNRLKHAWLKHGQEGLTTYLKSIAKLMEQKKVEVVQEVTPLKQGHFDYLTDAEIITWIRDFKRFGSIRFDLYRHRWHILMMQLGFKKEVKNDNIEICKAWCKRLKAIIKHD